MGMSIDKRIQRFVKGIEYEDSISIHLKDIDETFWFDDNKSAQEFLNTQSIERFGDKELRKGYFYYKDIENTIHKYLISKVRRGRIETFTEEVVNEEEMEKII